jgi:eukaryotic-like serine/threonine-protein kinase
MPRSLEPGEPEEKAHLAVGQVVDSWMGSLYRIIEFLGSGGSANTYLALCSTGKHKGLNFAVKAFRGVSKPERLIRFMKEINFLRSCDHPAVMRVFDEGIYLERYPFVVVEYLPQTLHDVGRMRASFLEKLSFSLHLLSALDYLRRLDPPVVHRDVKPRNIFVKGGSCILGDFGLMKHGQAADEEDREIIRASYGPRMPRLYRTPDLVEYLKGGPPPTPSSDVFQSAWSWQNSSRVRIPKNP